MRLARLSVRPFGVMNHGYRERLRAHITSPAYRAAIRRGILLTVLAWIACVFVIVRFALANPEGPSYFPYGGTTGYLVVSIAYWGVFCALFNFFLVLLARYIPPFFIHARTPSDAP